MKMKLKKKKFVKENFYLFLLAALIGILCNYLVSQAVLSDKAPYQSHRSQSPLMRVFDLPKNT